jgi:hypothetical protein
MKTIKTLLRWYFNNSISINNILLVLFIIIIIFLALIPIYYYRLVFNHSELSNSSNEWGIFGSFYNGIVGPFLAFINILVLIRLTLAASKFNKKNLEKQLAHSTCQEYQKIINDLTFDIFQNLENFRESSEKKYFERAIERLLRIKYFVDSFITEVEPLIMTDIARIIKSKENLKTAIDDLIKSKFANKTVINDFFSKKSVFVKSVFEIIIM